MTPDNTKARELVERLRAALDHPQESVGRLNPDYLGELVRKAWVEWAYTQPNPKPSWLMPYRDLSEPDKQADRDIGVALARIGASTFASQHRFLFKHIIEALSTPIAGGEDAVERVARAIDPYAFSDQTGDSYAEARLCRAYEKARAAIRALSTLPQSIEPSEAPRGRCGQCGERLRNCSCFKPMCSAQGEGNHDSGASPSGRATRASTEPQEGLGHSAGIPDADDIDRWEVRPCVDKRGNVTSYDICLPSEPGASGVAVIASVYSGKDVADDIVFAHNTPLRRAALREMVRLDEEIEGHHAAQGTEAQRAETVKQGSVHDGPVAESDAPTPSSCSTGREKP